MKLIDNDTPTPGFGKYIPLAGGIFFVIMLVVALWSIFRPDMSPPPKHWDPNDRGNVSVPGPSASANNGGNSGSGGNSGLAGNNGGSGGNSGSGGVTTTAPKNSK